MSNVDHVHEMYLPDFEVEPPRRRLELEHCGSQGRAGMGTEVWDRRDKGTEIPEALRAKEASIAAFRPWGQKPGLRSWS